MAFIHAIKAIEILDSRGNPTLSVQVVADNGMVGQASVPSGASTGQHEAFELRDKGVARYGGKGVLQAVQHVNQDLATLLIGKNVCDQGNIDQWMIAHDGTETKQRLGANAILGVSLATVRAGALVSHMPLYRYIGGCAARILPSPMMNILNGGVHADNTLDFQEFMICPRGAPSFREAVRWGAEIFHQLKMLLLAEGHSIAVGDEGGFAPRLDSNEVAIEFILFAIERAGYRAGIDVSLALDCAASEFYDKITGCYIEKKRMQQELSYQQRSAQEQIAYLEELCAKYPITSLEDALAEEDWAGWQELTERLGHKIQIVGDDLFVTNPKFLRKGIEMGVANAILIKPNQIGTLTETLETIRLAQSHGYATIISHRSGETEDCMIADIAVGTNAGQIKTGSLSRTDRVAKYNRLLHIENELYPLRGQT